MSDQYGVRDSATDAHRSSEQRSGFAVSGPNTRLMGRRRVSQSGRGRRERTRSTVKLADFGPYLRVVAAVLLMARWFAAPPLALAGRAGGG